MGEDVVRNVSLLAIIPELVLKSIQKEPWHVNPMGSGVAELATNQATTLGLALPYIQRKPESQGSAQVGEDYVQTAIRLDITSEPVRI